MSTRLVVLPNSTGPDGTRTWAQVAAENGCDSVEVFGSPWCIANGIDGLGICTERAGAPVPDPVPGTVVPQVAPGDFAAGIDAVRAATDLTAVKLGLGQVLQAIHLI